MVWYLIQIFLDGDLGCLELLSESIVVAVRDGEELHPTIFEVGDLGVHVPRGGECGCIDSNRSTYSA